jgi:predicted amidophosphoribosyltransferase
MPTVLRPLRSALAGLLDLALPSECAGCGHAGGLLCVGCRAALSGPARPARPEPSPPGLPLPWAVAEYAGIARAALLAHKEQGRLALAGPLGAALARSVRAGAGGGTGPLLLVPAPSRRAAVRARGHDPTLRLARAAAASLRRQGCDVGVAAALRLRAGVADQAGLSAVERTANLDGALWVPRRVVPLVAGRRVLVVDDVVTTGATIREAARALSAAGASVPAAAVVAATARTRRGGVSPGAAGV